MRKRPSQRAPYRKLEPDDEQGAKEGKAIVLHGFSPAQLHTIVALYRAQDDLPQDVAFAMVTPQSAQRRLGDVVSELNEDAKASRDRRNKSDAS